MLQKLTLLRTDVLPDKYPTPDVLEFDSWAQPIGRPHVHLFLRDGSDEVESLLDTDVWCWFSLHHSTVL